MRTQRRKLHKETFFFWAKVKGNLKPEQKNLSLCDFLTVQSRSLNSDYLYPSVLETIYLKTQYRLLFRKSLFV